MARTVPETQQDAIDFFANRLDDWAASPAAIGLSSEQVDAITARVAEAETRLAEAQAARIAAKTATLALSQAMADLRGLGGDLVKTIRTYAETNDDPAVYTRSGIPPVSPPTPVGPPEQPRDIAATITNSGPVRVSWRASRSTGTQFVVERQLVGLDGVAGDWTFVAVAAARSIDDTSLPIGSASVTYRVYAQRASGRSDASTSTTLTFGTVPQSSSTLSATHAARQRAA